MILYDVTASFTHWGMYNIDRATTTLPVNAGIASSLYGLQVSNDFGDLSYDGPCPPPLTPASHKYVLTVYALETVLPAYGNFPAGAEALYHALMEAAGGRHILGTARISGFHPGTN